MAGFSELIRNFNKTRDYVRDFFIYGCKIRSDFDRKSIRTYGDEKRRVESWLGDYMRYDDSIRGRSVSISVDSGHIPENPLYNAYRCKNFTDNDIRLHFFIIDILCDYKLRPLREIVDELNSQYGMLFDEQTVRNKLREYTDEGIVIAVKQGKTLYYSLSRDTAGDFMREFRGLDDAVKFFSETQNFGIVGNTILRYAGISNDLFFIKHNYIIHTLEDILLPDILSAITQKRWLAFTSVSGSSDTPNEKGQVVPMQILVSVQTGRRYLAAYIPAIRKLISFRLDHIRSVKIGGVCEEFDDFKAAYDRNISRCFGVSFGMRRNSDSVDPVRITFFVDEVNEPFILERLEREKRCGSLENSGDHLYTITADVFDPNEIMQWAKSFIGRIVRIEGGNENVRKRFYSDINKMYELYGGDDDEHIQ